MAHMKQLWENINRVLDTTKWSCEEIANYFNCPVNLVNEVVEQRLERHKLQDMEAMLILILTILKEEY